MGLLRNGRIAVSDRRKFLAGAVSTLALLWNPAEAALSGLTVLPTSGAVVPTVIWHIGSTVNDNNGISGNGFVITGANSSGAGNCLIIGLSFPYSAARTISISDSTGDTWVQAGSQVTDSANMAQRVYYVKNCTAGFHTLTITFDASLRPFGYEFTEAYNIDTVSPLDGTNGTASSAAPNVSAGSYTPTTNNDANGGHLIWTFARSNDKVGTLAANSASTMAPTGSQALLSADNTCTIPGCASWYVQATNGAINPGFTITQATPTNFVCSSIALKAASAGTAPGTGIRIKRILHCTYVNGGSSAVFQLPSDGNLLVAAMSAGNNLNPISSVADSLSQSYTNPGTAGNPQVFYHQNASSANNLKLTFTSGVTPQFSVRLYDIVNAQASSFLNTSGFNGSAPASGTVINNFPNHTPSAAPCLSIQCGGFGTGPGLGMASGAPAGSVFDLIHYTGETDQDRMDNADTAAHVNAATTAAQTWNFTIGPATNGSTAFATVVSFQ